jgi:hypothetical protein
VLVRVFRGSFFLTPNTIHESHELHEQNNNAWISVSQF